MPLQDILIGLYLIIKYLMDFMKDSFPDFACKYFDLHWFVLKQKISVQAKFVDKMLEFIYRVLNYYPY